MTATRLPTARSDEDIIGLFRQRVKTVDLRVPTPAKPSFQLPEWPSTVRNRPHRSHLRPEGMVQGQRLVRSTNGFRRASTHSMMTRYTYFASVTLLLPLCAQDQEAVVSKDTISVHTVERGNMPLRERASGSITSLDPPRVVLRLAGENAERCEVGQKAMVQVDPPKVITGKVVKDSQVPNESGRCEIELADSLPANATVGKNVGGLIDVGELHDVVFLGRPADSSPNSVATIFVVEAGKDSARRVTVHYGKISGPLIQVVEGISAGDRVIVTDMSKWAKYERVRLK